MLWAILASSPKGIPILATMQHFICPCRSPHNFHTHLILSLISKLTGSLWNSHNALWSAALCLCMCGYERSQHLEHSACSILAEWIHKCMHDKLNSALRIVAFFSLHMVFKMEFSQLKLTVWSSPQRLLGYVCMYVTIMEIYLQPCIYSCSLKLIYS